MARSVILGNGSLTVGLDEYGLVHDFYYPYVGLENLNNARIEPHHIGIWIDGTFSWLHQAPWQSATTLDQDAILAHTLFTHNELQIKIAIDSFVDTHNNVLIRTATIHNESQADFEIRLFFHQVFQISSEGRSDTALYVPDGHYILDYKGRVSLLINAITEDNETFDQYAVGNYGIEGKEGTYRDAEDGELSMSAVEHAGVDSVIRLSLLVAAGGSKTVHYFVIAADSQYSARKINAHLLQRGLPSRKAALIDHWQQWLEPAQSKLAQLSDMYRAAVISSLWTIRAHIDKHGGIIAACDSSIYNYGRDYYSYVWPRDGPFVIWPLIRLGLYAEAKRFFEFCRDIVSPDGYMLHKYQPDKAVGSTWHPLVHGEHAELAIQEDETALVLFMLGEYVDYSGDSDFARSMYETLIQPMANFMHGFIDEETGTTHASYDLWEEKFLSTTFSSGATYKALMVAATFAKNFGFIEDHDKWSLRAKELLGNANLYYNYEREAFRKGMRLQKDGSFQFDDTLDVSSLYAAFTFGFATEKQQITSTAALIEKVLLDVSPSGGTPRYEHDAYFKSKNSYMGNPWFVTTLWMAQYYSRIGDVEKANSYIAWALSKALPAGTLSEQVNPEDGSPVGVTPLVWSHAELINTILDVSE